MPWPLSQDYNEALQNPQSSFRDPELRHGQAVVNALGIPQPCSGNFADVYAVECPATRGKWAVKCFTREIAGLRERYSEISGYLRQIRLPFTVDFQYQEQGIRIAGRWYPILKMHWIEGFTLNAFVRDMLDKPAMLEKLSRVWVRLARRLREADLAHCDLQHGNVLLVPASEASALAVKLIDYDGMWVPALAHVPSGEVGHAAYQHPQRRRDGLYNAAIDRFPLLAIHVALRALIACGRPLWQRYDTGDNLLFRQADFEAPAKSPLFAELLRLNQPEIRALVVQLIDAARMPLEQTPHLADLVPADKSVALAAPSSPAPVVEAKPVAPNPFAEIVPAEATQERPPSLIPWIAAGTVAACALVGGVLLSGLHRDSAAAKPFTPSTRAQATSPVESLASGDQDAPPQKETPKGSILPPHRLKLPSARMKKLPPPAKLAASSKPLSLPKPKSQSKPAQPAEAAAVKPKPSPTSDKLPVPDEAILKSSTEEIQDIYKAEYAAKDSTALTALAEKLLKRARKDYEKPERRFVLFRETSAVAAKAGEAALSMRALDELGKLFAVEVLPLKTAALNETAKNLRSIEASKAVLESARNLLAEAVQADDYENAERLVKAAEVAAFHAGILRSALGSTASEVKRLKAKYKDIKPALARLSQEPNDPEANGLVGSFRCFDKGDWDNGLPLLSRGDDAKLKALADQDLAEPVSLNACVDLGDSWWQLGKAAKGPKRERALQRACHWYGRALPEAIGPDRTRLEKNICGFNQKFPALAWGHLDIAQTTVNFGALRVSKGDKEILTRASWSGPIEITAVARTEKNNIRLRTGKGGVVIFNWEKKPEELRVTRPDGNDNPESGSLATAAVTPLRPNTWYFLRWRLSEDGMSVSVNGREVFSEVHKNNLAEKHPISLHSVDSELDVLSFAVRPIRRKPR